MNIVIGGDLSPTRDNEALFIEGNPLRIWGTLTKQFKDSDLNIVNLECVLTNSNQKINKIGMHISASPICINGIVNSNIHLLSLANNHIMDFGDVGLRETFKLGQKTLDKIYK
jgi:poly-gamma-glutamate synthesis protein (capsule biosynthesis protein)